MTSMMLLCSLGPLDEQSAVDKPLQAHAVDPEAVEFDATNESLAADKVEYPFGLGLCSH